MFFLRIPWESVTHQLPYLHAAIMRLNQAARDGVSYTGSGLAVGGGITAQVASGTAQGLGVVGTLVGIAGIVLPHYFADKRHKREQEAKDRAAALINDAEKAQLRQDLAAAVARQAEADRRIKDLEKLGPQVEANRQILVNAQPKADAAFQFLLDAGVIADPPPQLVMVPVRVLVVEDHVPTARALVRLLGMHNFAVDYASSVPDAIDRLSGPVPFDWMTLDLKIDGGKGEDVLTFVRQRHLSTRVAVTTGTADRDRIEGLRPLRPDRVFFKPVNWTLLIEVLRSVAEDDEDRGSHGDAAGTT